MKGIIILLLCIAVAFAITGCEEVVLEPDVVPDDEPIGGKRGALRCTEDGDCVTGGCSGTICQHKDSEPVMTTCEFKPEYACYKQIECKCVSNGCVWDKTAEFEMCVQDLRQKTGGI
ncbi:MAG: eight-cysteine-cluster domain-containing protein [Nanoarchaeota archaeon]|nr:eight-cysteine-cluster domain-containing protein [Nanoarchaeota archaeon]